MIKEIGLLKRKPSISTEEFSKAWLDFAPTLLSSYPVIRKYIENVTVHLPGSEPPAYDGVAEAGWDDVESHLAALAWTQSAEGQGLDKRARPIHRFEPDGRYNSCRRASHEVACIFHSVCLQQGLVARSLALKLAAEAFELGSEFAPSI